LNRVLEHEPADLTATVQAGITMSELARQLGNRGQWWSVDPPWPESATLGGVLATNSSGPKRLLYGTPRDIVIGMQVVHADGTVTKAGGKVPKNVTGYDMLKLYINSLGTLAVIVEATLKLRPLPPTQQVVRATFSSADAGGRTAQQLLGSELLPSAVELVSPALTKALSQALEGPPAERGWSLLVGVDGVEQAVARQIRQLEELCLQAGATACRTGEDDGRLWAAIQMRLRPQGNDRLRGVVIRIGTVRTQTLGLLAALQRLVAPGEESVAISGRLGNGLIYASIPVEPGSVGEAELARALTELRASLEKTRGYLVIESAPPSFKARLDCWGDVGPQIEVMRDLKRAFDPRGVLNPGRYLSGLS
ncbi:MAG: FAD-binding oxidoreductase, partial [Candidatus Entotheonellia bacterium]